MAEREQIVYRTVDKRGAFTDGRSFSNTVLLSEGLVCDLNPDFTPKTIKVRVPEEPVYSKYEREYYEEQGKNREKRLLDGFGAFGLYVDAELEFTIRDAGGRLGVTGETFRNREFREVVNEIIAGDKNLKGVDPNIFGLKHARRDYPELRARLAEARRVIKPPKEEPKYFVSKSKYDRLADPALDKDEAETILAAMPAGSTTRYRKLGYTISAREFAVSRDLKLSHEWVYIFHKYLKMRGVVIVPTIHRQNDFTGYNIWNQEENISLAQEIVDEVKEEGGMRALISRLKEESNGNF